MNQDIIKILKLAEKVSKDMENNLNLSLKKIDEIEDEKTRDFLKNSVTLARKKELNLESFLQESKTLIENANRNTNS